MSIYIAAIGSLTIGQGECMSLAALISRRRSELGIGQEELEKRTGIRQSYLSQMETGKVKTTRKHIAALARGLEVSQDDVKIAMGFVIPTTRSTEHAQTDTPPMDAAGFLRFLANNPQIDVVGVGMSELTPKEQHDALRRIWEGIPLAERNAFLRELLEEE